MNGHGIKTAACIESAMTDAPLPMTKELAYHKHMATQMVYQTVHGLDFRPLCTNLQAMPFGAQITIVVERQL